MKYLDFSSLLEGEAAETAFFSTFQFDPDYFERRLLRCSALAKARRILVFLDSRQWLDLVRREVSARWLNRRYLVLPVHCSAGVFHPKLHLLLAGSRARVICGSSNLTRSGCSSNLELLNSISIEEDGVSLERELIVREAFSFFKRAAERTDNELARIATEWIADAASSSPWIAEPVGGRDRRMQLLHTYDGSIWDRLVKHLHGEDLERFLIVSPFHDRNGALCRRLANEWPRARVELLVQQGYTNLDVRSLDGLGRVELFELRNATRRLHAKLIAWETPGGCGCVVGSANFTSAAFDGNNIEASLLVTEAGGLIKSLFDRQLSMRPLPSDEFVPGQMETPESDSPEAHPLRIVSAVLNDTNGLRVNYSHTLERKPSSLRVTIRAPGENRPRARVALPNSSEAVTTVTVPEAALADSHAALLVSLAAEVGDDWQEGPSVWLVQEGRLTHEPVQGTGGTKGKIKDTGEGLPEYLDELGDQGGTAMMADYLRHLNIRFVDGAAGLPARRKFRVKIQDPFHGDRAPSWLVTDDSGSDELEEAIHDFVDRHERLRLRRHAKRGNINGVENFLDIFSTLTRLLYVYYRRGVVKGGRLVGRFTRVIEIATSGRDIEGDHLDSFLLSIRANLGGDVGLLREVCDQTHYLAEIRAALLIAQWVRRAEDDSTSARPRDVLPSCASAVSEAISRCALKEPDASEIRQSLESYGIVDHDEADALLAELPSAG